MSESGICFSIVCLEIYSVSFLIGFVGVWLWYDLLVFLCLWMWFEFFVSICLQLWCLDCVSVSPTVVHPTRIDLFTAVAFLTHVTWFPILVSLTCFSLGLLLFNLFLKKYRIWVKKIFWPLLVSYLCQSGEQAFRSSVSLPKTLSALTCVAVGGACAW